MPHETVDAIVVAAHLVLALQNIVARNIDPFHSVVVTVGSIHGGTVANAIATTVTIGGTVRTKEESMRAKVKTRMQQICDGTGATFGARCALQ